VLRFGIHLFTTDRGVAPARLAELAEERGFSTFWVPEHSHIPARREAPHPATEDGSLPDVRYMHTLDPWVSLAGAAVLTSHIELGTAVAMPVEHDPITLAKAVATLDHLSGGRVTVGVGFGWNTDELADHGVPPNKRRTVLREYLEAMRALWEQEESSYFGDFVHFEASWAWPKPVQSRVPVLVGAAGGKQTFAWIAQHADGWISAPREEDVLQRISELRTAWKDVARPGQPRVVSLLDGRPVQDPKPHQLVPETDLIEMLEFGGVTDIGFILPNVDEDKLPPYLDAMAQKLGLDLPMRSIG